MYADAGNLALGERRSVEGLQVALGHARQEQIPLSRQFVDLDRAGHGARSVPTNGGVQCLQTDLGLGDRGH